jgi:hypothetical protein
MSVSDWVNPCGGLRWRTLGDGTIEVEGQGAITFEPGSLLEKYVRQSWENFGPEIEAASANRGVPISAIVGVMVTESGLWSSSRTRQASQCSFCCCGPMAVWAIPQGFWPSKYGYTPDQIKNDPTANIDAGAALMREGYNKGYELPQIAAAYNSGSYGCCPLSPDVPYKPGGRQSNLFKLCSASPGGISYPEMAVRGNNSAIALGIGVSRVSRAGLGIGLALAGVGVAVAISLSR